MFFKKDNRISGVSVIVPTLNSEKTIAPLLSLLSSNYKDIIVGIDSKTKDSTRNVVRNFDCKIITIRNKLNYVEGMFGSFFDYCKYDWILRIDDDELLSSGLIKFTRDSLNQLKKQSFDAIGIHRKWCRFKNNSLQSFNGPPFEMDWQYRLFNKNRIKLKNEIHTSGFDFNQPLFLNQKDAYILHLDWIYHSYDFRLKKVKKYEKLKPTSLWKNYYLYESIPNFEKSFYTLKDEEWKPFIKNFLLHFEDQL